MTQSFGILEPEKSQKVPIFGHIIRRLKWILSSFIVQLRFREITPNILVLLESRLLQNFPDMKPQ